MKLLITVLTTVIALLGSAQSWAQCTASTSEIDRMEIASLTIQTQANGSIELVTRVADDPYERAAGFQHVCAQVAEEHPIYFQFERPFISSFHMRNVYAELDIAFIDDNGQIISIQRMKPNSLIALRENLYHPPSPALAALETAPGYYASSGIVVGDYVNLTTAPVK